MQLLVSQVLWQDRSTWEYRLRPAAFSYTEFPRPAQLFTVEDLGCWSLTSWKLIESLWRTEINLRFDLDSTLVLAKPGK